MENYEPPKAITNDWEHTEAYLREEKLMIFAEKMKDEHEARKEKSMDYQPKPIDTRNIELPEEINSLTEQLAASTHDVWAVGKMDKGYVYGETTSDADKTHADLIPYEELSEEKKDYDRNTAMETLKAIYALGYEIRKNGQ